MNRIGTFLETLQRTRTLEGLNGAISSLRDVLDVDHVVYHALKSSRSPYAALTYPDAWVEQYLGEDYSRIDPVVQACFRCFDLVDWRDLDWSGKARRAFMAEASAAGVGNQGMSIPLRGPSGQFAIFTVSGRVNDATWRRHRADIAQDLIVVAHHLNQKALEIERGTDRVELINLSPRESDTLRLLAAGMSRAQAADAMTISEHTVRAYIENARMKLGAMNTTHAVARAVTQGLLAV